MTSLFLGRLFSEAEFPAPVRDHIVSVYANRYLIDVALNPEICRADLFSDGADENDVRLLLCSSRTAVLNAVLDTDECRDNVLYDILIKYDLSDADQLRFASRNVPTPVAERALDQHLAFPPARKLLMQCCGRIKDKGANGFPHYYPKTKTTSVYAVHARPAKSIKDVMGVQIDVSLNVLAQSDMWHFGPMLCGALGDGESKESLDLWAAFFTLAQSAGDVGLKKVIGTAKTMALANK